MLASTFQQHFAKLEILLSLQTLKNTDEKWNKVRGWNLDISEQILSQKCYDRRNDDPMYGTDNTEGCKVSKSFPDQTPEFFFSTRNSRFISPLKEQEHVNFSITHQDCLGGCWTGKYWQQNCLSVRLRPL